MSRRAAGALLVAALSACGPLPATRVLVRQAGPTAEVVALTAREFDRSHAVLELALEIHNPGASLAVDRAQFEVLLDGRPFASGVTALRAQVPSQGRHRLTMRLSLAYLDVPFAARSKIQRGEAIEVVARGALGTPGDGIPFAGQASLMAQAGGGQER